MEKYIIVKNVENKKSKVQVDGWLDKCISKQIPYIVIKAKGRYADVFWDIINYSSDLYTLFGSNSEQISNGLIKIFREFADYKSTYLISDQIAEFEDIPIDNSELFAKEIYDYIDSLITRKV